MKKIPKVDDVFWKCVGPVVIARWDEVLVRSKLYSWVKHGNWYGKEYSIGWRCIDQRYYPIPNAFSRHRDTFDRSDYSLVAFLEENKWVMK